MIEIRPELSGDGAVIRAVNNQAFGQPAEADLVDALRASGALALSLVAVENGHVVGHILFSPVRIVSESRSTEAQALGPMAVMPVHQRQGIGSALVRKGLEECRSEDCGVLVVLGHPQYYPRFGFAPASRFGIRCQYEVPDDVFMAMELKAGALAECEGLVKYHAEFGRV